MKKALATINTDIGKMTLYYNGNGESITAEQGEIVEDKEYIPESLKDAIEVIDCWYGRYDVLNTWGLEWLLDENYFD